MDREEAIHWLNVILGSKSLKSFTFNFLIKTIDDIEVIRSIVYELQKNGWQEQDFTFNGSPDSNYLTVNLSRYLY